MAQISCYALAIISLHLASCARPADLESGDAFGPRTSAGIEALASVVNICSTIIACCDTEFLTIVILPERFVCTTFRYTLTFIYIGVLTAFIYTFNSVRN